MIELTGWTLVGVIAGGLVALLAAVFLFRISCLLLDVPEPSLGRSFLLVVPLIVVCTGASLWIIDRMGQLDPDEKVYFSSYRILALILCLLLTWLVGALVYFLALGAPSIKALWIAGIEILLRGLLASLVAAIILVVLACVQVNSRSQPGSPAPTPSPSTQAPTSAPGLS
jgi:hypothetical protein